MAAVGCESQAGDGSVDQVGAETEGRTVAEAPGPVLIAHRGASAYAPEHTVPAYQMALDMGADFIEPDLQITRDGVLIALHDETLERTTDVEQVFPRRYREEPGDGGPARRWYASDFTLEEIRRLDAGSWFGTDFVGARVPTFREVVELARGQAGVYPETKAPDRYAEAGVSMERLLVAELTAAGLEAAGADPDTPVVIQSFSAESLRVLREELGSDLPLTFLIGESASERWTTDSGLARIAGFADGIGPDRDIISRDPSLVERAHAAGLTVTPWTFRARADMVRFVCDLGVDGLFTDNPDRFPRPGDCTGAGRGG